MVIKSPCWYWESEIPVDICDKIIDSVDMNQNKRGSLQNKENPKGKREVNMQFIDINWIDHIVLGYIRSANFQNFNYNLSDYNKERTQFTCYSQGDFYHIHCDYDDTIGDPNHTRKLSLSLQLSDEKDYEGGDLLIYPRPDKIILAPKAKGSVIVFDSRLFHEVTKVTKGSRYSLVKWYHGDNPFM